MAGASLLSARALALMLPLLAALALHLAREDTPRARSAALFAGLWVFLSFLVIGALAVARGAVLFVPQGAQLYGVPVDLAAGAGIFCGVAALVARKALHAAAASALWLAAVFSPVAGLAVTGAGAWWFAGALALAGLVPASLLAAWTRDDRRVYARAVLQAVIWAVMLMWLFPSAALLHTGGGWEVLLGRPLWAMALWCLPLLLPGYLLVAAIDAFARYGDGTGFPYDPPKRVVTQGIYARLSNPMQAGICLAMLFWGIALWNIVVVSAAPLAFFLFVVFRDVCNGSANLCGADPAWKAYQERVPKWVPRVK